MTESAAPRPYVDIKNAVVRFAGDSGDGNAAHRHEFTREAALHGNDLATFPDYPAEIRAPAGTTAGVSGYQIQFAAHEVVLGRDQPDTLVAMNPAALKVHLPDLKRGGMLILNEAAFKQGDLDRAGWSSNPLADGSLDNYRVIKVDFEHLVGKAVEGTGVSTKGCQPLQELLRAGLVFWIYSRDTEREEHAILERFKKAPPLAEANLRAFKAGYNYGETIEALAPYSIQPPGFKPGKYRNVTGNSALALGLIAATQRLACGCSTAATRSRRRATSSTSSRRTAASGDHVPGGGRDRRHLRRHRRFLLRRSRPSPDRAAGHRAETEAMGLALMTELPLVIIKRAAGRSFHRLAHQDGSSRTSSRPSTGATASARSR